MAFTTKYDCYEKCTELSHLKMAASNIFWYIAHDMSLLPDRHH